MTEVISTQKIVNLTQHGFTPEQEEAGVFNAGLDLAGLLTFNSLPTKGEIEARAEKLADIAAACGCFYAMIGGAPYLMGPLEAALHTRSITPLYAFSQRESVEETLADGSVRKVNVFKHVGFIEA